MSVVRQSGEVRSWRNADSQARMGAAPPAEPRQLSPVANPMFLFFSNKLGCVGSLLLSAGITLLILVLLGWVQLPRW